LSGFEFRQQIQSHHLQRRAGRSGIEPHGGLHEHRRCGGQTRHIPHRRDQLLIQPEISAGDFQGGRTGDREHRLFE
jgi:hypothetical protein